jgi:hypothetical protein
VKERVAAAVCRRWLILSAALSKGMLHVTEQQGGLAETAFKVRDLALEFTQVSAIYLSRLQVQCTSAWLVHLKCGECCTRRACL